jgi:hypothetical protein
MIKSIKELYGCTDEKLQQDAGYIIAAAAVEPDILGDCSKELLQLYVERKLPQLTGKKLARLNKIFSEQYRQLNLLVFGEKFATVVSDEHIRF